ncbi:hypothetical protein V8G57_12380 [Collimonas sp. H4R21]|uniref:Uncharacterized protein n=1 Tax=Collimonas rhizosphaerae TaxID=3126357 RepID=A0ABU9PVZ4_9BURK
MSAKVKDCYFIDIWSTAAPRVPFLLETLNPSDIGAPDMKTFFYFYRYYRQSGYSMIPAMKRACRSRSREF